jgi:hypothetical protein
MSLTSRLSNLFASEPTSHLVPAPQDAGRSERDEERKHGADAAMVRKVKRLRTMAAAEADEDLELKRPPYIHVCPP